MISKCKKIIRGFATQSVGFTLIETLMAVVVLSIAIAGPLTIASKGLQATTVAKDQDTALYLAQDAVEYVRWARDTNTLAGGAWLAGNGNPNQSVDLSPCISTDGSATCYVDSLGNNPAAPTTCSSGVCPVLNFDSTNNYYTYNTTGTTQTLFTRAVSIVTPVGSNSDEAKVTVTVSWCDQAAVCAAKPRSVTVIEDIFHWQP